MVRLISSLLVVANRGDRERRQWKKATLLSATEPTSSRLGGAFHPSLPHWAALLTSLGDQAEPALFAIPIMHRSMKPSLHVCALPGNTYSTAGPLTRPQRGLLNWKVLRRPECGQAPNFQPSFLAHLPNCWCSFSSLAEINHTYRRQLLSLGQCCNPAM